MWVLSFFLVFSAWCCHQIGQFQCGEDTRYKLITSKFAASQQFIEIYFGISVCLRSIIPALGTIATTGLLVSFLQRRKQTNLASNQHGQQAKQMDQLTLCLVIVAFCFLLFVLPYAVICVFFYTDISTCAYYRALYVVVSLTSLNSSVNFGIYFWKLTSFRKAIKKVFHGNKVSDISTLGSSTTAHTQWNNCQPFCHLCSVVYMSEAPVVML